MSFSLVPGFGPGGAINFTLSGFQLHTLFDREKQAGHAPDVHNMGIIITTPFGGVIMEEEVIEKSLCPLDSQEQITLMRFDEIEAGDAVVDVCTDLRCEDGRAHVARFIDDFIAIVHDESQLVGVPSDQ